ncbi:MAG TPA: extracellular solute-binding protein [Patescibacteria group bacterium]|nr:extracellular solute-binding protein [Patescibacteria group bacterium]
MDDKTQNIQSGSQPPQSEPVAQNTPIQPQANNAWTPQGASQTKPEEDFGSKGPLSPSNITKLLVGIFAILTLAFVLFIFIVPNIGKGSEKVTLSYWGVLEDPTVMQPIISDFEKENPKITVDYKKQDIKDYKERLATRISQGTGPDIFGFQNTWYPAFSQVLLPMPSDTVSKDQFNKSFYPVAKKDLIQNGGIYGIPTGVDTLSLFVNTEIFKQAGVNIPKNWNDFINAARSLTVKDQTGKIKTSGAALGTFDNVTHAADIISLFFVQDGVDLDNLTSSKERVSDALRFYTAFALGDGSVWDGSLDPSSLAFSKGNLGMFFGYYWDYFAIKSANPQLAFEIDSVPQLNFQSQTISTYYAEGVSAKSKNQQQALAFMKFLARRDTQEKLYQAQSRARAYGQPPAMIDLSDKLQNTPISIIVSQAKNATSSYFAGEPIDNSLRSYLSTAVSSILTGTPPAAAADALITGVSQTLSQYSKK